LTSTSSPLYLFCAYEGPYTNNLNTIYLHPLVLSSSSPTPPSQNVSFNRSGGSILLFTTDLHGHIAIPISDDRPNHPLVLSYTSYSLQYISIDITPSAYVPTLQLHWDFPFFFDPGQIWPRGGAKVVYLAQQDSYFGSIGVNDISSRGAVFVLNIFKDIGKAGSQFSVPVFNLSWPVGFYIVGIYDSAVDQQNQLMFISLDSSTSTGGQLLVFDTKQNQMVGDLTYAEIFKLVYSQQRKQLLIYRMTDGYDQIVGIDILDWKTGKATTIIPQSQLPNLEATYVSDYFDDQTGEWYFLSQIEDYKSGIYKSSVFCVNVDTRKVGNVSKLDYDSPSTAVLAIYASQVTSNEMKLEEEKEPKRRGSFFFLKKNN